MKKFTLALSLTAMAFGAQASVLTFDNIQFTQFQANVISGYSLGNTNSYISALSTDYPGYGNLKWAYNGNINDFRVVEAANFLTRNPGTPANNGISNGLVSGNWVAMNAGGGDVWFEKLNASAQNFNFDSAYMSAAWYNGLKVDITGYRDGVAVYSSTTGPLGYNASLQMFNWTNLDKVTFHSEQNSGTVIDNKSTYNHAFVMDNLSVSAVPLPGSSALLLTGLALMGLITRRRTLM